MKIRRTMSLVILISISLFTCTPDKPVKKVEVLSKVYTVDKEYRSMMGPYDTQPLEFPKNEGRELVWVTGYKATMVGEDGKTPMPQEFMCHSNLDFNARKHAKLLGIPIYHTSRLFTLSQGQFEVKLPKGYGLPFFSDEVFSLTTQVLNLNHKGKTTKVRHKIELEYIRDKDVQGKMQPLFMTSGWGMVSLEDEPAVFGKKNKTKEEHGPGCLPGKHASNDLRTDKLGRKFSGHWVVKPGLEVNRTRINDLMRLPYDTTVHYIAVHLHPFAESIELYDRTAKATVYKSKVRNFKDKIGLEYVDYFSSEEGLKLYKNHEYEIISTYNNTTNRNQDSMAVMLFYLKDKIFDKSKIFKKEKAR